MHVITYLDLFHGSGVVYVTSYLALCIFLRPFPWGFVKLY